MEKERNLTVDIMKGLGILFVLIGHISQNMQLDILIYSFHMPLFFFISGITCNISRQENFISKKAKNLLIPYLIFSILTFIYWSVIERKIRGDEHSVISQFIGIFTSQGGTNNHVYNAVMWFLPCLFITELIFYLIRKMTINTKIIATILTIMSIIGFAFSELSSLRLPWSIDTMFIAIFFYGTGYLTYNKLSKYKLNINKYMLILIFLSINVITAYCNGSVNMDSNDYKNYLLYFISAFSGITAIYLFSTMLKNKFIQFLGCNSLIIMCVHEPIKRIIIKFISIISKINMDNIRTNIILILLCTVIIVICLIPLIYIINNYMQFMLGKAKKHKTIGSNKDNLLEEAIIAKNIVSTQ